MPATGPARVALASACSPRRARRSRSLPAPRGAAAAASAARPRPERHRRRLVVRTPPGAAAAVTRAAEAAGATRTGQVRRLHSVSFEVARRRPGRLRDRLLCRART